MKASARSKPGRRRRPLEAVREGVRAMRREIAEGRPRGFYLAAFVWAGSGNPDWEGWLRFHAGVGIEHFFVAARGMAGEDRPVLDAWAAAGEVTLLERGDAESPTDVLNRALPILRTAARWVAILQTPEFLFSPIERDLRRVLGRYEKYPGLVIRALHFPTAGESDAHGRGGPTTGISREGGSDGDPAYIVNPAAGPRFQPFRPVSFARGRLCVDEAERLEADAHGPGRQAGILRLHRFGSGDGVIQGRRREWKQRTAPAAGAPASQPTAGERGVPERWPLGLEAFASHRTRPPATRRWRLGQWRRLASIAGHEAMHVRPCAHYLSACLIFRNCARYLVEWIEFHRLVGVEHFYLYDHRSTDDPGTVLRPYVTGGRVTLHDWSGALGQEDAYLHCLKHYGRRSRWIAFIDDDEFVYPSEKSTIPDVLGGYEEFAGVSVPWLLFGTSGHMRRPEGLVLEHYTRRAEQAAAYTKSIVDPRRCTAVLDPHRFRFERGFVCVTGQGRVLPHGQSAQPRIEPLRINHYYTRSAEDVEAKINLRGFFGLGKGFSLEDKAEAYRAAVASEELNRVEDRSIQRYLPPLRRAVARPGKPLAPG